MSPRGIFNKTHLLSRPPSFVGRIACFQYRPTFSLSLSLSLVHRPSATSRRSEEAPTLRLTARSGALQAPVRPCHCRQLAATWHGAPGERRCRTRTCFAFERGVADTDRREGVCGGGALRLQGLAQAWHGFERGALTSKARVHYASVSKMLTIFCTLSMAYSA